MRSGRRPRWRRPGGIWSRAGGRPMRGRVPPPDRRGFVFVVRIRWPIMTSPPPLAVTTLPNARLDFSRCLAEAGEVYRRNFWSLVLAAIVTQLLSVVTLFVLM